MSVCPVVICVQFFRYAICSLLESHANGVYFSRQFGVWLQCNRKHTIDEHSLGDWNLVIVTHAAAQLHKMLSINSIRMDRSEKIIQLSTCVRIWCCKHIGRVSIGAWRCLPHRMRLEIICEQQMISLVTSQIAFRYFEC